jgi:hypothetical protein
MADEIDEYGPRAGMYRLLSTLGGADYTRVLDETLASPLLRDVLTQLVSTAFGAYVLKYDGDVQTARDTIARELRAAEDLDNLS